MTAEIKKYAIIGPPGTGKTTHLISIMKYIVKSEKKTVDDIKRAEKILDDTSLLGKYSRDNILFLTFSTSAEIEILQRLTGRKNISLRKRKGWVNHVRTLHSIAYSMLITNKISALKGFIDAYEDDAYLARRSLNRNPFEEFANTEKIPYDKYQEEQLLGNVFETAYNYAVNSLDETYRTVLTIDRYLHIRNIIEITKQIIMKTDFAQTQEEKIKLAQLVEKYFRWKMQEKVIDYAEMLLRAVLRDYPLTWTKLSDVKVLLIDEAQDLSPLQWALVRQIIKNNNIELVIVAGDPLQSIYSFQGANPRIFVDFIKDANITVLDESRRLPRAVKDISTAWASTEISKLLRSGIYYEFKARDEIGEVVVRHLQITEFEVERIIREIISEIEPHKKIFILTRTNEQARRLELELYKQWYAVKKIKNVGSLYERIADILAIVNKARAGGQLKWSEIEKLMSFTIFQTAVNLAEGEGDEKRTRNRERIKEIAEDVLAGIIEPKEIGKTREIRIGNETYFQAITFNEEDFIDVANAADSIEKITHLHPKTAKIVFEDFLTDPARFIDFNLVKKKRGKLAADLLRDLIENKIRFSHIADIYVDTMHASKGAEADKIIIIDHQHRTNLSRTLESKTKLEDEIRLYYVAMTRAREKLVIIKTENSFIDAINFATPARVVAPIKISSSSPDFLNW